MPSGHVHTTATLILAAAGGVAAYYNAMPVVPVVVGALAGVLLTPDLDLDTGSTSQRTVRERLGCLVGALWALYWRPYSMAIPHRSWLSHGPLIGTAIRVAYLCAPVALLVYVLRLPVALSFDLVLALAALAAADTLHFILDSLFKN